MNVTEAIAIVQAMLERKFGDDLRMDDGDTVVVRGDKATDYGEAWLIPINSKRYLNTGDLQYIFLPGAVLVPKDRQHPAHVPPSCFTIPTYLGLLSSGEAVWPAG